MYLLLTIIALTLIVVLISALVDLKKTKKIYRKYLGKEDDTKS